MSIESHLVRPAGSPPAARERRFAGGLSELGLELKPLLGGDALVTGPTAQAVAVTRRPQQAFADNGGLLEGLRRLGAELRDYTFRQFEVTLAPERCPTVLRQLLERGNASMSAIGAAHRPPFDTAAYRRLGETTPNFRLVLVTDRAGEHLHGLLGVHRDGYRILLSADGAQHHTWRT